MNVIWSAWALAQLEQLHDWHCAEASQEVADRIVVGIFAVTRQLEELPYSGQFEPWLEHQGLGHRRVVVGNYKVVYRVLEEEVRIVDVFDSRQDPDKMTV